MTDSKHNILISIPRTASNLLVHLLNLPAQPSIIAHPRDGYFFLPALSHRFQHNTFTRPYSTWSTEEKIDINEALLTGTEAWAAWIHKADEEGKSTYIKEHINWMLDPSTESAYLHNTTNNDNTSPPPASTERGPTLNPTVIPDTFWPHIHVTFLIRHPALTFPSALRTAISNEGHATVLSAASEAVQKWECTYRWHVLLYRFLTAAQETDAESESEEEVSGETNQYRNSPVIIDASDLTSPSLLHTYTSLVELSPAFLRTSWPAVSVEAQPALPSTERRMKDTLLSSTNIVAAKLSAADVDIAAEKAQWEGEFGDVLARRLEGLVEAAMGDYVWLFERRMGV